MYTIISSLKLNAINVTLNFKSLFEVINYNLNNSNILGTARTAKILK